MNLSKFISISIITPVFNRKKEITKCIDSVFSQNYTFVEHIIVDDGSTDGTLDTISKLAKDKANLRIISLSENWGVNTARNKGIQNAKNDYILFLDSDDYLLDKTLFTISEEVNKNKAYKHFLFVPDDKIEYYKLNKLTKDTDYAVITFKDWLNKNIDGDFVHLISRSLCQKYPFPEEKGLLIREGPNFLRYHKESQQQLFVNKLILHGDVNRKDSITYKVQPLSFSSLYSTYLTHKLYLDWFEKDYLELKCEARMIEIIKYNIFLSLSLGRYTEASYYLLKMKSMGKRSPFYEVIHFFRLGTIIRYSIYIKTALKLFKK